MTSQYGRAAGTRQGAKPKLSQLRPPSTIALIDQELIALRALSDFAIYGLYQVLCQICDFETGEVHRDATYAELMAFDTPPRPERGRQRKPHTYEQLRRMLRELESVGLVRRHPEFNAAQGRLLMNLPIRALAAAEWKKRRVQQIRTQALAQGPKARKAA